MCGITENEALNNVIKSCALVIATSIALTPSALAQRAVTQDSAAVMKVLGADLVRTAVHLPVIVRDRTCRSPEAKPQGADTLLDRGGLLLRALGEIPGIRVESQAPDSLPLYTVCEPYFTGDSATVQVVVAKKMGPTALARTHKTYYSSSATNYALHRDGRAWKVTGSLIAHSYDFGTDGVRDSTDSLRHTPPTPSPRRETPPPSRRDPPTSVRQSR